jgi:hypothetical protein
MELDTPLSFLHIIKESIAPQILYSEVTTGVIRGQK